MRLIRLNWEDIKYSLSTAENNFEQLDANTFPNFEVNEKYTELRNDLIEIRDRVFDANNFDNVEKLGYAFDLTYGLELYYLLNNKYNFKMRHAANNDIWRFLQIEIIPDIVHSRWEFNETRFFTANRRLWLKTLWWYIHLGWDNDKTTTYNNLKENTTDTVMQLVERPGIGYNIDLYREIMKKYVEYSTGDNDSRLMFRRVLILNTARIATIFPELSEGGIEEYVESLYRDVTRD